MARVLVTGGAGYIGSHTVVQLVDAGHEPVIVDSFVNADPAVVGRVRELAGRDVPVHRLDLRDADGLAEVFAASEVDTVIHFAGLKSVGESVRDPLSYYDNNVGSTLGLLAAMQQHGVRSLVFSSSATVYDPTAASPLDEDQPLRATNPYGWSKIMIERMLRGMAEADDRWRIAALRYFNPAGAHPSGLIGEDPSGTPNNLMPVLSQVAVGRLDRVRVYGSDYPTPDGTGIRDYIHVEDLAAGHLAALRRLESTDRGVNTWNLGTGQGTSVLQLLRAFEDATGRTVEHEVVGRRPGDVAESWADASKAEAELGWRATRSVADMCADTWRWQRQNINGYRSGQPQVLPGPA